MTLRIKKNGEVDRRCTNRLIRRKKPRKVFVGKPQPKFGGWFPR